MTCFIPEGVFDFSGIDVLDHLIWGIETVCGSDGVDKTTFFRTEITLPVLKKVVFYFVPYGFVVIQELSDFVPLVFPDIDVIVDTTSSFEGTVTAVLPGGVDFFQSLDFLVQFFFDFF